SRLDEAELGQERFGALVAVEDRVLRPFLVVDDELESDARSVRPLRIGAPAPVADQVAWIPVPHRVVLSIRGAPSRSPGRHASRWRSRWRSARCPRRWPRRPATRGSSWTPRG